MWIVYMKMSSSFIAATSSLKEFWWELIVERYAKRFLLRRIASSFLITQINEQAIEPKQVMGCAVSDVD